jgi:surface antigen
MQALRTGTTAWLLSSTLLFSCPLLAANAKASQFDRTSATTIKPTESLQAHPIGTHMTLASGTRVSHAFHRGGWRFAARSYGISCVPYARQVSGIMVAGNAWQWWYNAVGTYARGNEPEPGSILNFRANGRMPLGHVAVVARVVNPREVIVDHANWPSGASRGGVSHDVAVVDVSEANNWSAVRVELGHGTDFGSIYPTYGFIYNRPDSGVVTASISRPAPQPAINRVPSDLRPAAERPWHTVEEVAEAPVRSPRRIDLSITSTMATSEQ